MELGTLNLILLILILVMLFAYLFIRVFFTTKYLSHQVPMINSGNDVISNLDLQKIVEYYRISFHLENYQVIFDDTESFLTLTRGLNRKTKTITLSKRVFSSVGYEIDYLVGTLWFVSQTVVKKNPKVRFYNFLNRYGFILNLALLLLMTLLTAIIYVLVGIVNQGQSSNLGLQFLWSVPIFQIIAFLLFLNAFVIYIILSQLKPILENSYGKELNLTFNEIFKEYSFDLSAARNYATQLPLPHNFTFHSFKRDKFKWLGPFVKN